MTKLGNNIYKNARINADLRRDPAAEELNIATRTLDKYENFELPVPDSIVKRMCYIYNDPNLAWEHIKRSELGEFLPNVQKNDFKGATLQVMCEFDDVEPLINRICEIACNGKVNPEQKAEWACIEKEIKDLISAMLSLVLANKS